MDYRCARNQVRQLFLHEMRRTITHTRAQGQFRCPVLREVREICSRNILVVGNRTKRVQKLRASLKCKGQILIVVGSSCSQMLSLQAVCPVDAMFSITLCLDLFVVEP
jgi:hypothetical protein